MGKSIYTQADLEALRECARTRTLELVGQATPSQYVDGLTWYQHASALLEEWAVHYGTSLETAAAVMAILSPQCPYSWNVNDTYRVLEGMSTRYAIRRNALKAEYVLRTNDHTVVSGPKVSSFWHNLNRPMGDEHVTIDTWICRMVGLTASNLARKGAYDAIRSGITSAAKELGILPNQSQAIAWIVIRGKGS